MGHLTETFSGRMSNIGADVLRVHIDHAGNYSNWLARIYICTRRAIEANKEVIAHSTSYGKHR